MKRFLTYCLFVCLAFSLKAQVLPVRDLHLIREIEKSSVSSENKSHSSFGNHYLSDYKDITSPNKQYGNSFSLIKDSSKKRKLFIIPAYQMMYGKDFTRSEDLLYLRGGVLIDYAYKDKFAISIFPKCSFYELPDYLYTFNCFLGTLNGEGYFASGNCRRNFSAEAEFKVMYKPYDFLSLEAGQGKNKFGDGYRSFLLSENATGYQYLKLETEFLDIKYSCLWSSLVDISNYIPFIFTDNKYAVFHYLDWSISKRFNLGLFESIVINGDNPVSFEYMNPIIFFRPVEFNLGSEDNALLGINSRFSINNTNAVYGQFMLDDIIVGQLINDIKHSINPDYTGEYGWFANKWAVQLGYKSYDIFKVNGLDFFTEINIARPYIYSHANTSQNYSHWHQSLAHPLGANFIESVSGISYFGDKFKVDCKLMYAKVGMDTTNTHFGQDIFKPTMDGGQGSYTVNSYGNTILQGNKTDILTAKIDVSYFPFNTRHFAVNTGIIFRNFSPETGNNQTLNYVYIGIRSNIFDKDFIY